MMLRRRPSIALTSRVVIVLLALSAVSAPMAAAAPAAPGQEPTLSELKAQRNKVRSQKAAKAAEVNALKASDQQVDQALDDLASSVTVRSQQLEDAERALAQAQREVEAAESAEAKAEQEIIDLRGSIKQQAIDAYVNVPGEDDWSMFSGDDPNEALTRRTLADFASELSVDAAEQYRALQEDLAIQRENKANAESRAERNQTAVEDQLEQLRAEQERQAEFQAQVEARLDRGLSEAAGLAQLDSGLSSKISAQEKAIAAKLEAQRRAAAAAQARLASQSAPSAPRNVSVPKLTGSGSIVSVGGIRVHQSIAGNVGSLLNAASSAGIHLSGGGYRDPSGQIAVRRNNCGSSNYAIYQMPASSCRPPTARPGQSMHERGLAIDFTAGGRTLSRGSAGYNWLKANAASYGLYNLPSEPWHWSTNGN